MLTVKYIRKLLHRRYWTGFSIRLFFLCFIMKIQTNCKSLQDKGFRRKSEWQIKFLVL